MKSQRKPVDDNKNKFPKLSLNFGCYGNFYCNNFTFYVVFLEIYLIDTRLFLDNLYILDLFNDPPMRNYLENISMSLILTSRSFQF